MAKKQASLFLVTQEQILAAQEMWKSLPNWYRTDRVLETAKKTFPDNTDRDSVFLKVALLDGLYATNVRYYFAQAVEQVITVFGSKSHCDSRTKVIQLAEVQIDSETRHKTSFASKYIHFFHDDSVPIFDWYAAFALTRHLGCAKAQIDKWREDYDGYCCDIDRLKQASAVSASARETDHYLWLAGNWITLQEFRKKTQGQDKKPPINSELAGFFEREDQAPFAEGTFKELLK